MERVPDARGGSRAGIDQASESLASGRDLDRRPPEADRSLSGRLADRRYCWLEDYIVRLEGKEARAAYYVYFDSQV